MHNVEHAITVEKLGTEHDISKNTGQNPDEYAKAHAIYITQKEKEDKKNVSFELSPSSLITKNYQHSFNVGYLFLQKIYHELKLDKICNDILAKQKNRRNLL